MKTQLLPWQSAQWKQLKRYIDQQRIPQALLINGKAGIGKLQLAKLFAEALLCDNRADEGFACGQCHSCLLFQAQTHPDFILIEPEPDESVLKIELIRALLPKLALKPQFAGFRVVLIPMAEQMNLSSSNALLKCVEEPNERTVILFTSISSSRLPATIVSRCQKLALAAPDYAQATAWLTQHQVTADHEILLKLAEGSPLLALSFAQKQWLAVRNACFKDWMQLAKQQSNPVVIAEQWQKLLPAPILQWLCSWLTDLIKNHYTNDARFTVNSDLQRELQVLSKRLDLKRLYVLYDTVLDTQKNWQTNLNKQLLLEVILINWFNLNFRG